MNVWCAAEDETSTICHLPFGRRRVSFTAQHRSGPFRVAPAARKRHTSSCFTEQVPVQHLFNFCDAIIQR